MMVSLRLGESFLSKMLTDFRRNYDKKMQVKFKLNLVFLLTIFLMLIGCEKKRSAVTFENICREENQAKVELKGFLHFSTANLMTVAENKVSPKHLLVEHQNGTGGFIKVIFESKEISQSEGAVKVIGKVLKEGDSCVLQIEKVENP
jgi:hypothetical protein